MAMMVLLQSAQAEVLGITMVSGNAWEPEEVQHTLRMLELIHRTDVPVVPGAVFPLVRTEREAKVEAQLYGKISWYGAWGDLAAKTSAQPYAAGPLTNIALAISIDPEFAELTQGIVIMGGSMNPQTNDPEFADSPRHEFNFWFDPEAAHIVLRANWPRVDLTTVDISIKTKFTKAMLEEISASKQPGAEYIAKNTHELYYLWDELAAAAWLDPKIITAEKLLYVDVDVTRGPAYGDTLTWSVDARPAALGEVKPVHVQTDLVLTRFGRMFVELMKAAPQRGDAAR